MPKGRTSKFFFILDSENLIIPLLLFLKERGFNIVFQDFALFPHLKAYDNIVYGLKNKKEKMSKSEV